ncbi:alpha-dehydro-beta-deoxy-D-glucarate aldolase [Robbsia andropogonis]|uniref:Alpha-dehydro-beta-deoxy-D-glucarate aldolase n=1 Tax=Robbsia andropogonis TaxID=28092 RepID=A0A0F5JVF4_9BURK|nr:HpcH/HpaI aldolase/citrate lyase family protein [Robbsia andropogonis]KKB61267.1 alpha-dehydro-beta-deoxy-D-glucarate aldolase [Robbsia andropogonis]
MDLLLNNFKQALAAHVPQYGTWNSFASNYATEIIAQCGYDWMLIDGEHAPNSIQTVLSQLQAVAPYSTHPIVRTVNHDPALIKQLLDIGVKTLMVPMVETAEQAYALVRAMRYPPHGFRGIGGGLTRATRWDGIPDYLARADDSLCLIVQIESRGGLEHVEAIALTEGVHGLFVGPADLSAALGHPGNANHADVQIAIKRIIDMARRAGKGAGILAPVYDDAIRYQEWGASFIAVAIDIPQLRQGLTQTLSRYKKPRKTGNGADTPPGTNAGTY